VRVILIYPPYELEQRARHFPFGVAYVAAALRARGFAVRVVDMEGNDLTLAAAAHEIARAPADLVGLGGMVTRYRWVKLLVPLIRRAHPRAFILAGNSGAATVPHLYLQRAGVDACCLGEGEIPAVGLAEALAAGRDWRAVPGLAYLEDGAVKVSGPAPRVANLDELPWPAWDLFPTERYVTCPDHRRPGARHLDVVATRGCPYECTFCYRIYGRRVTRRSPAAVAEEIEAIVRRFRLDIFGFRDDLLMTNRAWLEELCHILISKRLRRPWSCLGRVDLVDRPLLALMRAAGCFWISYGVESGSPEILAEMKKGLDPAQAVSALRQTAAAGIHADASFMIGMPSESRATVAATVDLCRQADITATFNFVTPYPGSELYDWARGRGLLGDEDAYLARLGTATDFVVNLTSLRDEELIKLKGWAERKVLTSYLQRHPARGAFALARRTLENLGVAGAARRLKGTLRRAEKQRPPVT